MEFQAIEQRIPSVHNQTAIRNPQTAASQREITPARQRERGAPEAQWKAFDDATKKLGYQVESYKAKFLR